MTILYILLFIVCLSTLIMVHEAGHLITAKIFKVYCFEYAIGFGPRLFSFKRKNGETRYSLRAIPFGGFVSMYGENDAVPKDFEGVEIDQSRSINHIKHWKRAIVLTAGILMNFVLALIVFFAYEIGYPSYTCRIGHITVSEKPGNAAKIAGLKSKDWVYTSILTYKGSDYVFYDNNGTLNYLDSSSKQVYVGYNFNSMTLKNQAINSRAVVFERKDYGQITMDASEYIEISYETATTGDYSDDAVNYVSLTGYIQSFRFDTKAKTLTMQISEDYVDTEKLVTVYKEYNDDEYLKFYNLVPFSELITVVGDMETGSEGNKLKIEQYKTSYPDATENLLKQKNMSPETLSFALDVVETETGGLGKHPLSIGVEDNGTLSDTLGLSMQMDWHRNTYGEAVRNTFKDFGKSATAIFRGLGSLFTKEGIKNVGGIIAIGVVTTNTLEQNGFGLFIYYWAMISVNLGIVNLLPFPGLDGWQFLVTIVEGVAHKDIPAKVKNTVSAVGILLLFVLMILIVVKDLIMVV